MPTSAPRKPPLLTHGDTEVKENQLKTDATHTHSQQPGLRWPSRDTDLGAGLGELDSKDTVDKQTRRATLGRDPSTLLPNWFSGTWGGVRRLPLSGCRGRYRLADPSATRVGRDGGDCGLKPSLSHGKERYRPRCRPSPIVWCSLCPWP